MNISTWLKIFVTGQGFYSYCNMKMTTHLLLTLYDGEISQLKQGPYCCRERFTWHVLGDKLDMT